MSDLINAKEIVSEWLGKRGFDGLFNTVFDCECHRDDLAPLCYGLGIYCHPGYQIQSVGTCDENDFRIIAEKPEVLDPEVTSGR